MSDRRGHPPEAAERVIHNPISGERIMIRTSAAETDGRLLVFDLLLLRRDDQVGCMLLSPIDALEARRSDSSR
ncbi:MAG: hypothetical protein ABI401_16210 [Candidatus Dormibacter sp.]